MGFLESINKKLCNLEANICRAVCNFIGRPDLVARIENNDDIRRKKEEAELASLFELLSKKNQESQDIEGVRKENRKCCD